jgi:hypothetical protein
MSHALEELVGHFDRVDRSLLFFYVGLEQGPISFNIAPASHTRQAIKPTCSLRNTRSF